MATLEQHRSGATVNAGGILGCGCRVTSVSRSMGSMIYDPYEERRLLGAGAEQDRDHPAVEPADALARKDGPRHRPQPLPGKAGLGLHLQVRRRKQDAVGAGVQCDEWRGT